MPPRYHKRRAVLQLGRRMGWKRRRLNPRRPFYQRSSIKYKNRSRRSSKRRGRRSHGRSSRFRRFRRRRGVGPRGHFAQRVVSALTPPRTFVTEYGQEHTVPAQPGVPGDGEQCTYFMCEAYNVAATVDTVNTIELMDWSHMMRIADWYRSGPIHNYFNSASAGGVSVLDQKFKFLLKAGVQTSTVRNQSTEPVLVTAFYCRPRGNQLYSIGSNDVNVYSYLATGFANNGLDPGNVLPSTNANMHRSRYTPFRSWDFARSFKITRVSKMIIHPGQMKKYKLSVKQQFVRPLDWVTPDGNDAAKGSWVDFLKKFQHFRCQRFILFKISSSPAGFGAVQATYSKRIQTTTPTVVMSTHFRYVTESVPFLEAAPTDLFNPVGFVDSTTAAHNPAIVVPDGDVVGEEKDGF